MALEIFKIQSNYVVIAIFAQVYFTWIHIVKLSFNPKCIFNSADNIFHANGTTHFAIAANPSEQWNRRFEYRSDFHHLSSL